MRFNIQGKIRYVKLEQLRPGLESRVYGKYQFHETGFGRTEEDAANGILAYLEQKMALLEAGFIGRPIVTPILERSYGRSS